MKIIISPAKQMQTDTDSFPCRTPRFLERAQELLETLQSMSFRQLQELWGCSERLARQNWERVRRMDLRRGLTPAVLAYKGLQYTYMGPGVLEQQGWDYLCENLRILSGFYGILRADDGVACYRLEMQALWPLAAPPICTASGAAAFTMS